MVLDGSRPSLGTGAQAHTVSLWLASALTFVAYLALALLGLQLASMHGNASPLWPATGAAVAAVYVFGPRVLPALAVAVFAADLAADRPLTTNLLIVFSSLAEAVVASWLCTRLERRAGLHRALALPAGLAVGAAAGTGASALAQVLTGAMPSTDLANMALTWWVGDFVGGLLVAPALIAAVPAIQSSARRVDTCGRLVLVTVVATAASLLVFRLPGWGAQLIFVPLASLLVGVWLAEGTGAHVAALSVSAVAVALAARGVGPFTGPALSDALLLQQAFVVTVAVSALALAAASTLVLKRLTILVLVVGWSLSSVLFVQLRRGEQTFARAQFDRQVATTQAAIERRLAIYESALRGGAGYVAAVGTVNRPLWGTFAESWRLFEQYPGIRGIGVVWQISSAQLPDFERARRAEGPGALRLHEVSGAAPDPSRAEHYVITYVYPEDVNMAALGLDLASEPRRAAAAAASRDRGVSVRTERIVLVQDELRRPGFLLYVPVYDPALPVTTADERRRAFRGWVYAPFVTEDLFLSASHDAQLDFWVYDAGAPQVGELSATTRRGDPPARFEAVTQVRFGERPFTIGWVPGSASTVGQSASAAWAAAFAAILTLVIAGLVISMQTLNERATAIAAERTRELSASRERALEASRVKSQFLANMSHEIRTPLNGVIGMTEMLLFSEPLTAQQRDHLDTVRTSAMNLLAIVNDILDLSRIEAGRVQLESGPFSIEHVVGDTIRAFDPAALRKGLALSLTVAPGTRVHRIGDQLRVRQIVGNLVANAIKFTERGRVEVRLADALDGGVLVSVTDTGIGISEDRLAAVFEAFTQADGTTTRRYGGTGLGLTICVDLARAMGGDVTAESALGQGSCFTFAAPLPVVTPTPAAAEAPTVGGAQSIGRPLDILVAEDDSVNMLVLEIFLAKQGHRVTRAVDGVEAVAAVTANRFDIVFMDVQMPGLDGLGATRRIREWEQSHGGHVPIIALTANAMRGDDQICFAAGMDGYLTKPIELRRILEALATFTLGARDGGAPA